MSLRVDYDERAIGQAAAFPDDPQGIRTVLDAIDRLAEDPRHISGIGRSWWPSCHRVRPRSRVRGFTDLFLSGNGTTRRHDLAGQRG